MKRMLKSDLVIVLDKLVPDDRQMTVNDLILLFDAFGDNWVIGANGEWIKTTENEAMAVLRNEK